LKPNICHQFWEKIKNVQRYRKKVLTICKNCRGKNNGTDWFVGVWFSEMVFLTEFCFKDAGSAEIFAVFLQHITRLALNCTQHARIFPTSNGAE
jgi:hypothetical protein